MRSSSCLTDHGLGLATTCCVIERPFVASILNTSKKTWRTISAEVCFFFIPASRGRPPSCWLMCHNYKMLKKLFTKEEEVGKGKKWVEHTPTLLLAIPIKALFKAGEHAAVPVEQPALHFPSKSSSAVWFSPARPRRQSIKSPFIKFLFAPTRQV